MDTTYTKGMTVESASEALASLLTDVPARLAALGEARSEDRPTGMSWSRKEILGHLIDSASNNHQRFVRAQFQAQMSFPPYTQDEWINAQGYGERRWADLVELWKAYNSHLLHIMKRVPRSKYAHSCVVSKGEGATLEELMVDYVGHLRHHLDQIFS